MPGELQIETIQFISHHSELVELENMLYQNSLFNILKQSIDFE